MSLAYRSICRPSIGQHAYQHCTIGRSVGRLHCIARHITLTKRDRSLNVISLFHWFLTGYFSICQFFLRYCNIGHFPMSPSLPTVEGVGQRDGWHVRLIRRQLAAGSWQMVFNTKNLPNQFLLFVILNPFPLRTPECVVQRLPIIILQVMKIQTEDQYYKFRV